MGEIIELNQKHEQNEVVEVIPNLVQLGDDILYEAREDLGNNTLSVPIDQLVTLGAGASSLLPALRTITQTTTVNTEGLYRLANKVAGDTLKAAKDGNFWGAFKTAEKTSKMVKLAEVGPLEVTNKMASAVNPATMMMAVALFSIEKQLGQIAEMQKQIISFLEIEKQSEIEADVETLGDIIKKYKHSWDNKQFVASNHKLVLDIQRTARKNMLSYQKAVSEIVKKKELFVVNAKVSKQLNDMKKKFQYYKLSLYSYAMSSLLEIMLSGNFKAENVDCNIASIEQQSASYRELFTRVSAHLEKVDRIAIDSAVLKGLGIAGDKVGKAIGHIPLVQRGPVDELLQEGGAHLKEGVIEKQKEKLISFAELNNPDTGIFLEKMRDMELIFNQTSEICFDNDNIYLRRA